MVTRVLALGSFFFAASRFGIALPDEISMTIRDRAYTSPIWYAP